MAKLIHDSHDLFSPSGRSLKLVEEDVTELCKKLLDLFNLLKLFKTLIKLFITLIKLFKYLKNCFKHCLIVWEVFSEVAYNFRLLTKLLKF